MSDLSPLGLEAGRYILQGLSVHPLPPGEKRSRLPWAERQTRAMTPLEAVQHWLAHPEDNVAIITGQLSGLVVVDVDPAHGGDPAPFQGTTPLVVRTRSGGWHFYYAHPGAPQLLQSRAGVRPGVDVRADGGYVVAPPSQVSPGDYRWEGGEGFRRGLLPLVAYDLTTSLPLGLAGTAAAHPEGTFFASESDPSWLTGTLLRGAPIGEQRQALVRLAGYFASRGLPADVAYGICLGWALRQRQRAERPWLPRDIQALVESIYAADARRGAARPPCGVEPMSVDAVSAADDSAPTPMACVSFSRFMRRHEGQRAQWTVEDWLPQATIAMVVSPPGGFKTWLLCELALSVAMGQPFLGQYPVHQPGPVLFLQQEDPPPLLASRLGPLAISKHTLGHPAGDQFLPLPEVADLHLCTDGSFNFGDNNARLALVQRLERFRPVLVILDPLYTACPAGQFFLEMPTHIQWLKRLRDQFGCSFLLAHHTKKMQGELGDQGREQMWGSNLMNAAIESGWQLRPVGPAAITVLRHFKVSGNKDRRKFEFSIDTERVPTMIVTESALEDAAVAPAERPEVSDLEHLLLATLRQENRPLGVRELIRIVGRPNKTVRTYLDRLVARGLLTRDGEKRLVLTQIRHEEVAA